MTNRAMFGTDGIRGVANRYPMTPDNALRLGQVLALRFRRPGHRPRIIVGKDTRLSGYVFESAITAGLTSAGAEAWQVGVLPTPGIAYITGTYRADAGVVISASHNPFQDNGIKVFAQDGTKLPDEVEAQIEASMRDPELHERLPVGEDLGRAYRIHDSIGRYVTWLKGTFPRELTLDGVRIVVDCANGAAYRVAPAVFRELGADVVELGTAPNGTNINKRTGALYPDRMAEAVRATGAALGVALDGDADRAIFSDEKGNIVDGDHVLGICAARLHAAGKLADATVVGTVLTNLGLERVLRRLGIRLVRTAVGDRHIVEQLRQHGWSLGGEPSGHIVFAEHANTGDGCLAALQVLAVMLREERPLSELATVVQKVPQVLVSVRVQQRPPLSEFEAGRKAIRAARERLGDAGRIVVRYSGTEPKVRIMVEGEDPALIDEVARSVADVFRTQLGG